MWFLDYIEGNLTESQTEELMSFLDENPDLKQELDAFDTVTLNDADVAFPNKNDLKQSSYSDDDFIAYFEGDMEEGQKAVFEKEVHASDQLKEQYFQWSRVYFDLDHKLIFEEKDQLKQDNVVSKDDMIAYHEGDLSQAENQRVLASVSSNLVQKRQFDLFGASRMSADEQIIFPNKAELKKKDTKVIVLFWRYAAVAASLILLMTLYWWRSDSPEPIYVEDENPTIEEIKEEERNPVKVIEEVQENQVAVELENNDVIEEIIEAEKPVNKQHFKAIPVVNEPNNNALVNNVVEESAPQKQKGLPKAEQVQVKEILAIENISPLALEKDADKNQIEQERDIPKELPVTIIEEDDNVVLADAAEPKTILEFASDEVSKALVGKESKEVELFDVAKKVGDKTKLYELKKQKNKRFKLKIAGISIES